MSYTITAAKLQKLYGYTLHTKTRDGSDADIRIPAQPAGWPRTGAEAIGLRTELDIKRSTGVETIPAFLKLFRTEVREREQRTRLLIMSELARRNDFFFGIPFGWLGRFNVNGVELIAHFTRMIRGPYNGGPEDFGRLRSTVGWKFDQERRRKFAAELAVAVAGLERAQIVHGDISPGNILVGHDSSGGDICILCDYDGFHNSQVPRLPRKDGKTPCRPLGTPGYQYPALIAALEADTGGDGDIWVETDRFALGVAIVEMMVWSSDVEQMLQKEGRGQLLPDELISKRDLAQLPKRIIDAFPDGFILLDKALRANGLATMPSPEDWLRVLGFDDQAKEYKGRPMVTVFRRRGTARSLQKTIRLANNKGDLGKAMHDLAGTTFEFTDQKLEFRFKPGIVIKRRREGKLADITSGVGAVKANPGDTYYVGEWDLELHDHIEAQSSI